MSEEEAFWGYADPSVMTCELPGDVDRPTPARSTMLTFTVFTRHEQDAARATRRERVYYNTVLGSTASRRRDCASQ